ncbi:hypothetical protein AVDCRST_MAG92-4948, partial [uncultured Coleofasciculus sp.]
SRNDNLQSSKQQKSTLVELSIQVSDELAQLLEPYRDRISPTFHLYLKYWLVLSSK